MLDTSKSEKNLSKKRKKAALEKTSVNVVDIEKGGNMNDENLIDISTRPPREHKRLSRKGAKKSNEVQKEKKEKEKQKKSYIEILQGVLETPVKSKKIKQKMKDLGIEGDNYFTAMCAFSTVKNLQQGNFNTVAKIIELMSNFGGTSDSEENKSFNNLIEAIKNVRKTKPKTK